MGVSIMTDESQAVFYCNTSGRAFGPTMSVAAAGEQSHRKLAREVSERADGDVRDVWVSDPDQIYSLIEDVKLDVFSEIYDEADF